MPATPAASIVDLLLGLLQAPTGQDANNRFAVEGVTLAARADGTLEIGVRRFEATSLRIASGPLLLELGRLALDQLVALVRVEGGKPRLLVVEAAGAEVSGVKVQGPVSFVLPSGGQAQAAQPTGAASAHRAAEAPPASAWSLGPLATAEGRILAQIVDAHLVFDANVTVPIRQGQVDFNQATVEHVGPDSRMGVSRMGLYVDAPNGRSYLYQFASVPVAGVEFERRGALLGPRVADRGSLRLQPFGEGLMRQPPSGPNLGLTDQARLLFDRTAVSGDVQLGDGRFAAPGVEATLVGRAEGRNVVRLQSPSVGRGLTVEITSLAVRNAMARAGNTQLECGDATGVLMLRLFLEQAQLRFAFDLAKLSASRLRLQFLGAEAA